MHNLTICEVFIRETLRVLAGFSKILSKIRGNLVLGRKTMKITILLATILAVVSSLASMNAVFSWSNGGYSDDPSNPKYGTHDWIGQHALDWLPQQEKQYILSNLAAYLYGTELPDNGQAPDGIGDTTNHHVYYHADGSLQEDNSADRAGKEYLNAENLYKGGDVAGAVKRLGIMTHYICDVAVFGHVMGSSTDWGKEVHHSDYENYVNTRTDSYTDEFNTFLAFDGALDHISAYDAALTIANDTTFDLDGDLTCVWVDQNYNWTNPTFKNGAGESLNLAVNLVADVLHTFYVDVVVPEFPPITILPIFMILVTLAVLYAKKMKKLKAESETR